MWLFLYNEGRQKQADPSNLSRDGNSHRLSRGCEDNLGETAPKRAQRKYASHPQAGCPTSGNPQSGSKAFIGHEHLFDHLGGACRLSPLPSGKPARLYGGPFICYNATMSKNFWKQLKKPIMALAPLDDVTDSAFRAIIAKYGKPDVMYTEFTSADGLANEKGRKRLIHDLRFSESERPIIAQFFGAEPKHFTAAAKLAVKLGFDGIDINMGCPDKAVCKACAGANLIENPELAKKIILATKKGANGLPVSVKTRAGYNAENVEEWMGHLLDAEPAAIVLHARTKKELSEVPARWELVEKAVRVRDAKKSDALILGNGDVRDLAHARELCQKYGADGAMLGRAIFGNPWLFYERDPASTSLKEKLTVLREHVLLYEKHLGDIKPFDFMKKHFKSYMEGFPGAKKFREPFMKAKTASEVVSLIDKVLAQ